MLAGSDEWEAEKKKAEKQKRQALSEAAKARPRKPDGTLSSSASREAELGFGLQPGDIDDMGSDAYAMSQLADEEDEPEEPARDHRAEAARKTASRIAEVAKYSPEAVLRAPTRSGPPRRRSRSPSSSAVQTGRCNRVADQMIGHLPRHA